MRRPPWRRLGAFILLPLVSAISPLVALPAITGHLGASGWAAIAIGQSIGTFAGLLVDCGWGTVGPPEVARGTAAEARQVFRSSVVTRLLVAGPVLAVAGVVAAALVPPEHRIAGLLMAVAIGTWGLGPTWFFIGTGRPAAIAVYDTLPKLAVAVIASLVLAVWPLSALYPALVLVAAGTSVAVSARRIGGRGPWRTGAAWPLIRANLVVSASRFFAAGFTSLAVALVAVVAPAAVPVYAALDRFRGFGFAGVAAVANAFSGWIFEGGERQGAERRRTAFITTTAAGLAAGAVLALGLPLIGRTLLSGVVRIDWAPAVLTGVAMALIAVSLTLTYHVLAPARRTRTIAVSALAGSLVGTPALLLLAHAAGATGAAVAIVAAEATVVAVQAGALARSRA